MAKKSDGKGLYYQGNGISKDDNGDLYRYHGNGTHYLVYDAQAAREAAQRAQEEWDAQMEREKQYAREAMQKAGGLEFLNPLNIFSSKRSGGLLDGILSDLAGDLIGLWCIIFLLIFFYALVIDPIVRTIKKGIDTVSNFFSMVFAAVKEGLLFVWKGILFFFGSWIWTAEDVIQGAPAGGFFRDVIFRVLSAAEIGLVIAYLVFLINKFRTFKRIPKMIKDDVLEPTGILLGLELIKWLIFRSAYVTGLPMLLYNVFCLSAWVMIAEMIIIAVFRKKYGLW